MTSFPLLQHILELKAWHQTGGVARQELSPADVVPESINEPTLDDDDGDPTSTAAYIPPPSEIRAACLRIQQEWSETERRRRAGWRDQPRSRVMHMLRVDTIW
jgi:hypothetical protein